jgi:hypothetical protein
MMPLILGGLFYLLGTFRSRVIAGGKPPNHLSRSLRLYGTIWPVGEGYLMLAIRALLDGTPLYQYNAAIVILATIVWLAILCIIAIRRNRRNHDSGDTRPSQVLEQ